MSVKEEEPCVRQSVWQVQVAVLFLPAHVYSQTRTLCTVHTESAWKDLSLGLGKELWARLLFSSIVTVSVSWITSDSPVQTLSCGLCAMGTCVSVKGAC